MGASAFRKSNIETVVIGSGVTELHDYTFNECSYLKTVVIGGNIKKIGYRTFYKCNLLTDVYYIGSEEEWNEILVGQDNDPLFSANIHFNASDLPCFHTNTITFEAIGATCTSTGLTEGKKCSDCSKTIIEQQSIPAIGHKWDNGTVTTQPTEGKAGVRTYTCTVCKETKTEDIPALKHEHKYTAVITAPTCTEKGFTTHTCVCGDTYKDSEVPAKGHVEILVNIKEATEKEEGYTGDTVCYVCNETLKKGEVIPMITAVNYGDVDDDGTVSAKDATQILRYINGKSSVFTASDADTALIEKIADVDGDGSVTAKDATQILRHINGKTSVFENLNK